MANTRRITLYAALDSPFPHRVRLALEEAKATYDTLWIDLLDKPEWYEKKVYPKGGRVPVLIYGGPELHPDEEPSPDAAKLVESTVILEFLADIFPDARLLPTDPVLRARARHFYQIVDSKLLMAFLAFMFMNGPPENVHAVLEVLQEMLPPTGYAVGEWSIADAALMPILVRWVTALETGQGAFTPEAVKESKDAYSSPRFARLRKYFEDNVTRPSMKKTYDRDLEIKTFAQRLERFRKTGIISSDFRIPVPGPQK